MDADGSGVSSQLTDGFDFSPHWSPDGSKILFHNDTCVNVVNTDGSDRKQLIGDSFHPAGSPDSSRIVFARSSPSGSDIWVMNADGSGAHRLLVDGDNLNWLRTIPSHMGKLGLGAALVATLTLFPVSLQGGAGFLGGGF